MNVNGVIADDTFVPTRLIVTNNSESNGFSRCTSFESGQQFVRGPFADIGLGDVQVRHQRRLSGVACQGPQFACRQHTHVVQIGRKRPTGRVE